MSEPRLEHVNLTVADPRATAARLVDLFGWRVRWQGEAIHGGFTVHVGGQRSYLALYARDGAATTGPGRTAGDAGEVRESHDRPLSLNHVGVVVDDLDAVERRVVAAGHETYSHADYEPGRRFYFRDGEGLEYEVVSYAG